MTATRNLGQPFEFGMTCETCGAGATPIAPLYINATLMGRKALDFTAHDLRIVVRRELADSLRSEGLSGFVCHPVAHKTETRLRPDDRYVWLEPTLEWPPLHKSSIVARQDQCSACRRSGHFDSPSPPTSLRFRGVPPTTPDFGATYEYFGHWRAPGKASPNVGGGRLSIVSERFKTTLVANRVRHVSFEPIQLLGRDF